MIPIRTNTQLMQFLSVLKSWCLPLCSKYYADTLLPVIDLYVELAFGKLVFEGIHVLHLPTAIWQSENRKQGVEAGRSLYPP